MIQYIEAHSFRFPQSEQDVVEYERTMDEHYVMEFPRLAKTFTVRYGTMLSELTTKDNKLYDSTGNEILLIQLKDNGYIVNKIQKVLLQDKCRKESTKMYEAILKGDTEHNALGKRIE